MKQLHGFLVPIYFEAYICPDWSFFTMHMCDTLMPPGCLISDEVWLQWCHETYRWQSTARKSANHAFTCSHNSLKPSDAIWRYRSGSIDGTKPLTKPILTSDGCYLVVFACGQFRSICSRYLPWIWDWELSISDYNRGQCNKWDFLECPLS